MPHVQTTNRLLLHFERGLRPRNPVRGEVREGGEAPSEFPRQEALP